MPGGRTLPRAPLVLVALLAGCAATAQSPKGKPKVLLYKDRLAAQFDTVDCVKNVLKLNPLLFLRGEVPLYYERALTPRLSIELGLGITLRDYLGLSIVNDDADDFGAGTEIIANPSYRVAVRFYLGDDLEPQGWYIQPEFGHLRYTKDILAIDSAGAFTDQRFRDERSFNDLRLLGGYQMLSMSSNWLFDFYFGAGFRDRDRTIVSERLDTVTRTYTYSVEQKRDQVPVLFLGVKVGLGF